MNALSIILPIYNVEKYLRQCLDSILVDNEFKEEVICVNDGSTDGSLAICEEYAVKYDNVRIVSQHNGGLSAARNTGVRNASGEYVLFLDSDDYLLPNVIDGILKDISRIRPNVLCCNVSFNGDGPQLATDLNIPVGISGTEFVKRFYSHYHFGYPIEVWHYVCNREFLLENNLWNKEGYLHEDEDFTPRLLLASKNIAYHPEPILFYRIRRPGAISTTKTESNIRHKLKIAEDLLTYYDNYPENVNDIFYEMLYVLAIDTIVEAKAAKMKERKLSFWMLDVIAKGSNMKRSAKLAKFSEEAAQAYFYGKLPKWKRNFINILFNNVI